MIAFQTCFLCLFDHRLKMPKLGNSKTRARSRADHDSFPSGLTRLMRSNVLSAAGTRIGRSCDFCLGARLLIQSQTVLIGLARLGNANPLCLHDELQCRLSWQVCVQGNVFAVNFETKTHTFLFHYAGLAKKRFGYFFVYCAAFKGAKRGQTSPAIRESRVVSPFRTRLSSPVLHHLQILSLARLPIPPHRHTDSSRFLASGCGMKANAQPQWRQHDCCQSTSNRLAKYRKVPDQRKRPNQDPGSNSAFTGVKRVLLEAPDP